MATNAPVKIVQSLNIRPQEDDPDLRGLKEEFGFSAMPCFTMYYNTSQPNYRIPQQLLSLMGRPPVDPGPPDRNADQAFSDTIHLQLGIVPPPSKKDCAVEVRFLPSNHRAMFVLEVPPEAKRGDELRPETRGAPVPMPRSVLRTDEQGEVNVDRSEDGWIRITFQENADDKTFYVLGSEPPALGLRG